MSSDAADESGAHGTSYVEAVERVSLPPAVRDVVSRYEAAGGQRDRFLWRWIYDLLPTFTLSTVPSHHADAVRVLKTKLTVLVTLLDDVAESAGDTETFGALRRVVEGRTDSGDSQSDVDADLVTFGEDLWRDVTSSLRAAPRHDEFRAIFDYDLRQVLNAMDYSRVLNENPRIATVEGARRYDSHNMVVFPYADVDVMYSPAFDPGDLGPTRDALWDLQTMARIGNWLTTWRRELREGDFSSGVVVYALQHGIVSPSELEAADAATRDRLVERIETHRIEALFESEWRQLARRVSRRDYATERVDVSALVDGIVAIMDHHVASEGYK